MPSALWPASAWLLRIADGSSVISADRAQRNDQDLAEMDPPSSFTLTLRPYQKQALNWMSNLETGSESGREGSIHPLWQQWKFNLSPQEMQTADGAMLDVDEFPDRELRRLNSCNCS